MTGTVSNLLPDKGYGFVSGENGQEYFFHMSDCIDDSFHNIASEFNLHGGGIVKVDFDPEKTQKGPRARNVVLSV